MAKEPDPQRFGKCLVEREIGRGARSVVYLAWHEGLQIPVAVKVMSRGGLGDEDQFAERFMREARIAAQLSHTNIVRVYDCGETEGSFYLVLEYIEGQSCKDRMARSGPFDWPTAARIVRAVADGLKYASTKGIIHRDLKPENIMMDKEGNARIADLGLAKEVRKGAASATAEGDVLGTPYYMSPEQVRQPGDVDFRSDIYSLGATLYHMVTGEVPFEAPTPFEIMTMHLNEPVTPPQVRNPNLPRELCDIIMRAMAKEPQSRYQSYGDLIRDLDSLTFVPPAQQQRDEFMNAVEDTLDEVDVLGAPAGRPSAEEEEGSPADEVVPEEIPCTNEDVAAKTWAVTAFVLYVVLAACIHQALIHRAGPIGAMAALVGLIVAAACWGYWVVSVAGMGTRGAASEEADERVAAALARLCSRLNLPTPRLRWQRDREGEAQTYSFFNRRAVVYVPGASLNADELTDEEVEAALARYMAGVYNGDADWRTLLALPVGLLLGGSWLVRIVCGIIRPAGGLARLKATKVITAIGLVLVCAVVATLLYLNIAAGLFGVFVFALLLIVAKFERQAAIAADLFAARVTGNSEAMRSVVVSDGLRSTECYRLVYESMGPDVAEKVVSDLPPPEDRAPLVEGVSNHFAGVPFSPHTLEMASRLFSRQPFSAERLNRLAGIGAGRRLIIAVIFFLRTVYSGLLGLPRDRQMPVCRFSLSRPYAVFGVTGGLLAVAAVGVMFFGFGGTYRDFLIVVGAFATVLGFVIAHRASREGRTVGQLGWALASATVFFTTTMVIGFCISGWERLSRLALQFPISFVLTLALGAVAGAIEIRFGPSPRAHVGRPVLEDKSRTAHTLTMPADKREAEPVLEQRNRARAEEESAAEEPE